MDGWTDGWMNGWMHRPGRFPLAPLNQSSPDGDGRPAEGVVVVMCRWYEVDYLLARAEP